MNYRTIALITVFFSITTTNSVMAGELTRDEIHFYAVAGAVCSSNATTQEKKIALTKEFPKFASYSESEIVKFCAEHLELVRDIEVEIYQHTIAFQPIAIDDLADWISRVPLMTKERNSVETDFQLQPTMCGESQDARKLASALYALLMVGEKQKDVENADYYYKRCQFLNEKKFMKGISTLENTGKKAFKISEAKFTEISIRAHFDHVIMHNKNGRLLHELSKDSAIEIVLRRYYSDWQKYEKEIMEMLSDFEGKPAMKPFLLLISEFDRNLFKKITAKYSK